MKKYLPIAAAIVTTFFVATYLVPSSVRDSLPDLPLIETTSTTSTVSAAPEPSVAEDVTENPVGTPRPVTPAPAPAPTITPNLPYTAVVVYDGKRFIPDYVTIIEGGTVRFINTGPETMWIASDNHPTHDRYPIKAGTDCAGSSFDQCAAVDQNDDWSFTFARLGTWDYHNHERAKDRGSVKVMTAAEYLKNN